MSQWFNSNLLKTILGILTLSISSQALGGPPSDAEHSNFYPQAALVDVFTQEQFEQQKADDLERQAIEQRDKYEKKKRDVEKQVAAHRFQIEELKLQQEKALSELDALAADMQHVNGDLASYQAEHLDLDQAIKATYKGLEEQKKTLSDKQKAVDGELAALNAARKKAEHEIYVMGIEIENSKAAISKSETRIQEAEARRAASEADEMRDRAVWMRTKMAAAEINRRRFETQKLDTEAQKHFAQAHKEMNDAKDELAKAEKSFRITEKRVKADLEMYEHNIQVADKRRLAFNEEREQLDVQAANLKASLARKKDESQQAQENETGAEGLKFRSSIALEAVKTAGTNRVNKSQQEKFKAQKQMDRDRGLASAEEASKIMGGGRIWVTEQVCKAYTDPDKKKAAGAFDIHKRLLGKDHGSQWVEIMNGTRASVFVESRCGKYED